MGLIRFAGGVGEISGSIAGNTFARNRSGFYVRHRTKPVNPNTSFQQVVRAAMALLTTRWSQTLDAVQRAAWNLYASNVAMKNRLGESIFLTGMNHYIRSNSWRAVLGIATVDAGPTVFELPAKDPTLAITVTAALQNISTAFDNAMDWAVEDGAFMLLYQGVPQNGQRNFFAGPWRSHTQISGIDPGGAVTPSANAVEFPIAAGQRQWLYARISRADGRLSEPFYADAIVVA